MKRKPAVSCGLNDPDGGQQETYEIELDRLQRIGAVLLILAVLFTIIGTLVSPRDAAGSPVLLLPEVQQMEVYRRSCRRWVADFHSLDRKIATAASDRSGDLFSQSHQAQAALLLAVQTAQAVDRAPFPPAGFSLHTELSAASLAYLDAAQALMIWIGSPEDAKRAQVEENLELARQSLADLEQSQWLVTP